MEESKWKETKGCFYMLLIPILFICVPIALLMLGGWFFTSTSVGQVIGNTLLYAAGIVLVGTVLVSLVAIGGAAFSSTKENTGSEEEGCLAAIIAVILFVCLMLFPPKSCSSDIDHVHYERYHQ